MQSEKTSVVTGRRGSICVLRYWESCLVSEICFFFSFFFFLQDQRLSVFCFESLMRFSAATETLDTKESRFAPWLTIDCMSKHTLSNSDQRQLMFRSNSAWSYFILVSTAKASAGTAQPIISVKVLIIGCHLIQLGLQWITNAAKTVRLSTLLH